MGVIIAVWIEKWTNRRNSRHYCHLILLNRFKWGHSGSLLSLLIFLPFVVNKSPILISPIISPSPSSPLSDSSINPSTPVSKLISLFCSHFSLFLIRWPTLSAFKPHFTFISFPSVTQFVWLGRCYELRATAGRWRVAVVKGSCSNSARSLSKAQLIQQTYSCL